MNESIKNTLEEKVQGTSPDHFSARIYIKRSEEKEEMRKLYAAESALAPFGVRLSVGPSRYQDNRSFLACVLNVHIDREITSRGAGRHSAESGLSLENVERMIAENMSPQEIATKIGFSLATYYRHMKKAMIQKNAGRRPSEIPF